MATRWFHGRVPRGVAAIVLGIGAMALRAQETAAEAVLTVAGRRGGLILHLGCGDGVLTGGLYTPGRTLVHGLDADLRLVQAARQRLGEAGLYGAVSVEQWTAETLPHADNLVNLVVVSDAQGISTGEIMRVLSPGGVVVRHRDGAWTKTVKPVAPERDEWTHFLHGPGGNMVSADRVVGPPGRLQWSATPKWARSHEHQASVSAVVTANGRLFAIVDEGPIASVRLPSSWVLTARDAYSGVLLWTRPISIWEGHLRPFRSGPAELPRRLVAAGDVVYVTLGYGEPVVCLDAASGAVLQTYDGTDGATEILYNEGILYLVCGDMDAEALAAAAERRGAMPPPRGKRLAVLDADSGVLRWSKADALTAEVMPLTLAMAGDRLYFHNPTHLVCLDAADGSEVWRRGRRLSMQRPAWSTPTLVVYDGVVLCADRDPASGENRDGAADEASGGLVDWIVSHAGGGKTGQLIAYAADNGTELWRSPCSEGYNAPVDVLVADGLVWTGQLIRARQPGITEGRDPRTGEVKRTRPPDQEFFTVGMSHHRCHRNRATERFLVLGRAGVEFVDLRSGDGLANHWVRGGCQFGTLPANGLLYAPPHSCACYLNAKLTDFNALAPVTGAAPDESGSGPERVHGPAFRPFTQASLAAAAAEASAGSEDWPTFRHDAARSGRSPCEISLPLREAWRARAGSRPSSPVIAGGRVFVADVDGCRLLALDASSGRVLWVHTAGGPVDSPPTVVIGRVVFGSRDGRVSCLDAADGRLIWRFRAGPRDLRIVVNDRLESAWPIHGSVLVQAAADGESGPTLTFAAGRSTYLDGGLILYRLDLESGTVLTERRLNDRDPVSGREQRAKIQGLSMEGVLPDILSAMGDTVFMRHSCFDKRTLQDTGTSDHLFSPTGFLDDSWWHRSYWLFGTRYLSGWGGWWQEGNRTPSGRLLVFDDGVIYGYGRSFLPSGNAGQWNAGEQYRLFATDRPVDSPVAGSVRRRGRGPTTSIVKTRWSRNVWIQASSMVLAGETLYVAGPGGDPRESFAAYTGSEGVMLKAIAAATGEVVGAYRLDALPVFDGMAVARGSLFLSMRDGTIRCLRSDRGQPLTAVTPKASEEVRPPAPDPPPFSGPLPALPDGRGHPHFHSVQNGRVGIVETGYRIAADKGKAAVVLRELPAPLTGVLTLSLRLQAVPGYTTPDHYRNGFLAFGGAPEDSSLVKCGIKFLMKKSMIITGPTAGGRMVAERPLVSRADGTFELTARVDTEARTVMVQTDGKTMTAPLPPSVHAVRYVGYTVLNGVTDVSAVTVKRE